MDQPEMARFEVRVEEGPPHGDLYELEQTTYFHVVDTRANRVVMTFRGEMAASLGSSGMWDGYHHSGVAAVVLAPDGRAVRVSYHDGREETVALAAD